MSSQERVFLISSVRFCASFGVASAFQCASQCNRTLNCPQVRTNCTHGQALDVCGCCLECAKGENESCNGLYYEFGRCADGLHCVVPVPPGGRLPRESDIGYCTRTSKYGIFILHAYIAQCVYHILSYTCWRLGRKFKNYVGALNTT